MAFWAIYKHSWFKRNIPNMISFYKSYLYEEWYKSLSEDEQKLEDERLELIKKQKRESAIRAFTSLGKILGNINNNYHGNIW